jgi:5-enolpyruvylshikimate-3-phosphate synthase
MRALELSEDVTAQIRSGALGTEIPSGSLRATSKAWQRITMNKQIHDLRETAAALMARAEKSTNIEEIAQLKLQAREAEAQAVQLRADEPGLEDLVPA